jgi:hypothetical protein
MPKWSRRFYSDEESEHWQRLQDDFDAHFTRLGSPRDMMLVLERRDDGDMLYMMLPNGEHTYTGNGFEEIDARDLPKKAMGLISHQDRFLELFELQTHPTQR